MAPMPMHVLFHEGFLPKRTGYGERGKNISLRPTEKETVLVFQIDQDGVASALGIGPKEPRCDAVMLYIREEEMRQVIRLVAMEHKGGDHVHAIEQLNRTLEALRANFSRALGGKLFDVSNGTMRAVIVSRTNSPQQFKKKLLEFEKKWKFAPKICRPDDESGLRQCLA